MIGFAGLRPLPDAPDLELYYGLDPRHWGHGYATEAARGVLDYGFDVLGLEAIPIRTDGPNAASVAVMERLGARYLRTDATGAFGTTIVYVVEPRLTRRRFLPPGDAWVTTDPLTHPRRRSPWSTRWSSTAGRSRPVSGTTSSIPRRASPSRSARAARRRTSRTPCRRPPARSRPGRRTRPSGARS